MVTVVLAAGDFVGSAGIGTARSLLLMVRIGLALAKLLTYATHAGISAFIEW